jgi:hypothetical protein
MGYAEGDCFGLPIRPRGAARLLILGLETQPFLYIVHLQTV